MLLTSENYSRGFLIDEELMGGVTENPSSRAYSSLSYSDTRPANTWATSHSPSSASAGADQPSAEAVGIRTYGWVRQWILRERFVW